MTTIAMFMTHWSPKSGNQITTVCEHCTKQTFDSGGWSV